MSTIRIVLAREGLVSLLMCLACGSQLAGGEAAVNARPDEVAVTLRSGETIHGVVLVSGPRGHVLATEDGEQLETFVPADEIAEVRRLETTAAGENDAVSWTAGAGAAHGQAPTHGPGAKTASTGTGVRQYRAEPVIGILKLVGFGPVAGGTGAGDQGKDAGDIRWDDEPDGEEAIPLFETDEEAEEHENDDRSLFGIDEDSAGPDEKADRPGVRTGRASDTPPAQPERATGAGTDRF